MWTVTGRTTRRRVVDNKREREREREKERERARAGGRGVTHVTRAHAIYVYASFIDAACVQIRYYPRIPKTTATYKQLT
jgi:hypothetical protein